MDRYEFAKNDKELQNAIKLWLVEYQFFIPQHMPLSEYTQLKPVSVLKQICHILGYTLEEIEPSVKELMASSKENTFEK